MSLSVGKKFEQNFKASVPEDIFCYRPPDAATGFNIQGNSNLRFSAHSPCDFMIFNGSLLFCFELKTVAGTSISFERNKEEKGEIHYYQIDKLKELDSYNNMHAGLIIDFRGSDNTYYLGINKWDEFMYHIDKLGKKSFSEKDLLKYENPIVLEKKKLKVNYRYDVIKLLEYIRNDNLELKGEISK